MISLFALLKGFVIGLSIAAPVGPIGILCIRRTLAEGRAAGFISGLGAATADAAYGVVAAFGLTAITSFMVGQRYWLALIGGLFLVYLGIKTITAKAAGPDEGMNISVDRSTLVQHYFSTFLLTIANPLTILSFAAIFAGLGVGSDTARGNTSPAWIVLGIFLGSGTWWFSLSGLTAIFRRRLSTRWMAWINRISGSIITMFGIFVLLGLITDPTGLEPPISNETSRALVPTAAPANLDGFQRVTGPLPLSFPKDHGAHPEYLTEWWYYTGNLSTIDGRQFGYQFTIFRRSIQPPGAYAPRPSLWATDQVYLAHFTVTDVQSESFQAFERTSRGAVGLAGAISAPFKVWLHDWQVEQIGMHAFRIKAVEGDYSLALDLTDEKGPVLHGNAGYSQKGVEPGNASIYISLTRLRTEGTVRTPGGTFEVAGTSWMDHEFSTNALSNGQVGWDWFSVQLEDNSELMVYQIRREDGTVDPYSSGTYISQDGSATSLNRDEFTIEVLDTWESPHSGAVYPSKWRVRIDSLRIELEILPLFPDQELNLSYTYWEGAVAVRGVAAGQSVAGTGYVELTGYREPFIRDF